MNVEAPRQSQPAPTEQVGLTPEQEQVAIALKRDADSDQSYYNGHKYVNDQVEEGLERDALEDKSLNLNLGHAMLEHTFDNVANKHFVNKSVRAARRHYKKHEVAYEEQAEIEATREGKEIHR